ncbi:hypothetical protein [Ekhidna sp.]
MKEDRLEDLLKDSLLKTSDDFTDQLMGKVSKMHMQKIRLRLNALIVSVIACFGSGAFLIIRFGIQLNAFGFSLDMPKIAPLVGIGFVGLVILLHLTNLSRMISSSIE